MVSGRCQIVRAGYRDVRRRIPGYVQGQGIAADVEILQDDISGGAVIDDHVISACGGTRDGDWRTKWAGVRV